MFGHISFVDGHISFVNNETFVPFKPCIYFAFIYIHIYIFICF